MTLGKKHADHDYITNRQNKFIEAWSSGSAERLMGFMDKDDYSHSDFGMNKHELDHDTTKGLFARTFKEFGDLKMHTRSLHGHKQFTAWEWTISYRHVKDPQGGSIEKKDAPLRKLIGCTLMWWNDKDKIIRSHEYTRTMDIADETV